MVNELTWRPTLSKDWLLVTNPTIDIGDLIWWFRLGNHRSWPMNCAHKNPPFLSKVENGWLRTGPDVLRPFTKCSVCVCVCLFFRNGTDGKDAKCGEKLLYNQKIWKKQVSSENISRAIIQLIRLGNPDRFPAIGFQAIGSFSILDLSKVGSNA